MIILLIPTDLYTNKAVLYSKYRIGYFADKITEKTFSLGDISELSVNTKNCITYLLENTDSKDKIELYISADRSTTIDTPKESGVQKINVQAGSGSKEVQCFVELKIPGGVSLPTLTFTYNGDTRNNVLLFDYKDDSTWTTPMKMSTLTISVTDAYPNVFFKHAHEVTTLSVTGTFCVCNFHNMKITTMTYATTVGSLSIIQNSAFKENKVTVRTPKGVH